MSPRMICRQPVNMSSSTRQKGACGHGRMKDRRTANHPGLTTPVVSKKRLRESFADDGLVYCNDPHSEGLKGPVGLGLVVDAISSLTPEQRATFRVCQRKVGNACGAPATT